MDTPSHDFVNVDMRGLKAALVASRLELPVGESLSSVPGPVGARARALVAGLAVRADLCPAAAVARYFKRARATLCEQMAASRMRKEDRQILGTPMRLILDELEKLSKRVER